MNMQKRSESKKIIKLVRDAMKNRNAEYDCVGGIDPMLSFLFNWQRF